MFESDKEITTDIHDTLEQLVKISEILKTAKTSTMFAHEIEALEKTQESLLARLMHRQSILEMEKRQKTLQSIRQDTLNQNIAEYGKKTARALKKSVLQRQKKMRRI